MGGLFSFIGFFMFLLLLGGLLFLGFFWVFLFFATEMTFQNAVLCLSALENANSREKSPERPDLLDLFSLTFNHLGSVEYDISVIPNCYTLVL